MNRKIKSAMAVCVLGAAFLAAGFVGMLLGDFEASTVNTSMICGVVGIAVGCVLAWIELRQL